MLYCPSLRPPPPRPPPPLSGRSSAPPEGLLKAASCLFDSQRETKPVSCTPLSFRLPSSSSPPPPPLLLGGSEGVRMMQEVSIMVAYDAHVVDRPGEEDTLTRLVAHSRPLRALRPVVGLFLRQFFLSASCSFVSYFFCSRSFVVFLCICNC